MKPYWRGAEKENAAEAAMSDFEAGRGFAPAVSWPDRPIFVRRRRYGFDLRNLATTAHMRQDSFAPEFVTDILPGLLAERVGFEPTVRLHVHTLSKRAP